jgi:hypothetical protein
MLPNAVKFLTHPLYGEMVKEFSAWIVTKTYTTSRRGIAVLTSSESVVDITLGATSAGLGELTPSAALLGGGQGPVLVLEVFILRLVSETRANDC